MKNRILGVLLLMALSVSLVGCKKQTEEVQEVVYELTAYSKDELVDNTYYVLTDSGAYPVAPGTLSISEDDMIIPDAVSDSRVLWYGKDDVMIPTLYANQSLIYVTKDQIPARWVFERFEDVGYTVGLLGLTENSGGRFETTLTETSIHPDSTAIQQLNHMNFGDIVGIDQIGSTKITKDYVSRGGTITGLSKGQVYNVDVYQGSNFIQTQMSADTHAFVSYELYETAAYTYHQSTYVSIEIPDYFMSGYYYINGMGLFRYVAGDSSQGISGISFNTPYYVAIDEDGNLLTKEQYQAYKTQTKEETEEITEENVWKFTQSLDNTMEELSFYITYEEMQRNEDTIVAAQLELTREDTEEEEEIIPPTATLLSPSGEEYPFVNSGDSNTLSVSVKMPISGEWIVTMKGMEDRIFNVTSNVNSGNSNSMVHSGNGSAEMNYYLTNALFDGQFEITWENKDRAAVIRIEGPDGTVYLPSDTVESASDDTILCDIIKSDYGVQILHLGGCISGDYKIIVTGEELGRVRCTATEYVDTSDVDFEETEETEESEELEESEETEESEDSDEE